VISAKFRIGRNICASKYLHIPRLYDAEATYNTGGFKGVSIISFFIFWAQLYLIDGIIEKLRSLRCFSFGF